MSDKTELTVMTPKHSRWGEFQERMGSLEVGHCCHDYTHAIESLNVMSGIDIDESIEYFRNHGGHCDCEIIFNIILPAFDRREAA